ncbi:MAG TPA: hypothetical protein DCE41_37670 [Cytophagales bacterium]|nr:hypothetical protein [Cytophagales bacterium]HAA20768.1 hypothetical protein [Cytophagales bacterium]HAP62176.1 hypothetical protein [Cytophagales bacterium]
MGFKGFLYSLKLHPLTKSLLPPLTFLASPPTPSRQHPKSPKIPTGPFKPIGTPHKQQLSVYQADAFYVRELALSLSTLGAWKELPEFVFILENEITCLTFPARIQA